MKILRAAAVPLVVHDPYFSIWSDADRLNDKDPVHWSGARQALRASVCVAGTSYSFLGEDSMAEKAVQKEIRVTATSTEYSFSAAGIPFEVRFVSPLLLSDPYLVSRPVTYIDVCIPEGTHLPGTVSLRFSALRDLVSRQDAMLFGMDGSYGKEKPFSYAMMGRAFQKPLGDSSDNTAIDWGYAYLASDTRGAKLAFDSAKGTLELAADFSEDVRCISLALAYDDLVSINYFGTFRKALWTEKVPTILDAIEDAFLHKNETLVRAAAFDGEIEDAARRAGGEQYAFLSVMSYRQTVAAHKLIRDEEGELIFLSRENDSNSCIGTVDVSYPSVPLFLLYGTEYVKGMLRPVFRFADCPVWNYDFAPHDVGRYPYAWGQVYGLKRTPGFYDRTQGSVCPPVYSFPESADVFELSGQMPVEECGNMLIMTAAVSLLDGNADFAKPYLSTLKLWTKYLIEYGEDPGEQLCTDDFAGHLAHNVNLSLKAIMGIEAYAILLRLAGEEEEAALYHAKAEEMAKSVKERADASDHTVLAYGNRESWSLKYNAVWDRIFGSGLFEESFFERELAYYNKKKNEFGVPLDSRADYTKSDWILWCAAMSDEKEKREALIAPVASYLEKTVSRYPFSDWYDTKSGKYCHFKARSVQGGIYMPILADRMKEA